MVKISRYKRRKIRKQRSKHLFGRIDRPRVIISKSNLYLTAQAIDDYNQKTLSSLCTSQLRDSESQQMKSRKSYNSKIVAEKLGLEFAKKLTGRNIENIIFDRNGYAYHGKIQVFCETMRKSGIIF